MDFVFHLKSLVLNFEEEVFFAENVGECAGCGARGFVVVLHQALGHFALETAGKADQSTGMLGKKLLADARLVVEAVQRCLRGDFDEIAVTLFVFGQHQQVVVRVAIGRRALNVMVGLFADVKFASDDGLHTCMLGGIDEVDGAENISVVGHGHSRHPHLFYALAELFDITGAIEQGIVRMEVQVDELGHVR